MLTAETKEKIKEHYDLVSPYYQKLWGNHIHHGYWVTGKESKEVAAENLIKLLVGKAQIKKKSKVLDIGCGVGGTSIWLAKNYDCKVTGITISPIQVEMATRFANEAGVAASTSFKVSDANNLATTEKYDLLWSVEMISHLKNREYFLTKCAESLEKGGKLCIADWFRDSHLDSGMVKKYVEPIESGMMVELWSSDKYRSILEKNGLKLRYYEDISENTKKTWDICLEIIKKKEFWALALKHGVEFVAFLKAFDAMRKGFASGAFRYEVMVFEK